MVNGIDHVDQVRRLRTSLIFLAISLAGFYYSSQVFLKHGVFWWVKGMAVASCVLFIIGIGMSIDDWLSERSLRDRIEEKMQAETEELRQSPEPQEGDPAEAVGEYETPERFDLESLIEQ